MGIRTLGGILGVVIVASLTWIPVGSAVTNPPECATLGDGESFTGTPVDTSGAEKVRIFVTDATGQYNQGGVELSDGSGGWSSTFSFPGQYFNSINGDTEIALMDVAGVDSMRYVYNNTYGEVTVCASITPYGSSTSTDKELAWLIGVVAFGFCVAPFLRGVTRG